MTLEQRIKEIEELSLGEASNPYEETDLDDVISSADYQGSIDTAKKALSIIKELQNKLQEMTKCRDNALEMPTKLARENVRLNEENQQLFNKNKELEAKLKEVKND